MWNYGELWLVLVLNYGIQLDCTSCLLCEVNTYVITLFRMTSSVELSVRLLNKLCHDVDDVVFYSLKLA